MKLKRFTVIALLASIMSPSPVALARPAADQFHNARLMVSTGEGTTPTDSIITLDKDTLTVRSKRAVPR